MGNKQRIINLIKKYKTECIGNGYCHKHCCYGDEKGCPKCRINFPIYLRIKGEVLKHSDEWEAYKIMGWLK